VSDVYRDLDEIDRIVEKHREAPSLLETRAGVTGQEMQVLAGVGSSSTPVDLFQAKTMKGSVKAVPAPHVYWRLEEPIARLYRIKAGLYTGRFGLLRHQSAEHRFALAACPLALFEQMHVSPDPAPEMLLPDSLLEKSTGVLLTARASWRHREEWGPVGTDRVPEEYRVRAIWEMGVTGTKRADVAVLMDDELRVYTIPFRDETFEGLYQLAEIFMTEHVLPGVPPPPDGSESYQKFLARIFPKEEGSKELLDECPENFVDTVRKWAAIQGAQRVLDIGRRLYAARISHVIGERAGLRLPFGRVTWLKGRDSSEIDWRAACGEARRIARALLQTLEDRMSMDAKQRQEWKMRLAGLEETHTVKSEGGRSLELSITKEWKAALEESTVDLKELREQVQWQPDL